MSLARAQHDSNALVVLRRLGKLVVEGALVPLLSLLGGHFGLVLGPHVEPVVALPAALILDQRVHRNLHARVFTLQKGFVSRQTVATTISDTRSARVQLDFGRVSDSN